MTAGEAIKMADELRPNNHFENQLKQLENLSKIKMM
jgi:uncharacterized protein YoaH (UPF0181 family)